MVRRELDFDRIDPEPDWAWYCELAQQCAATGWPWRIDLHDHYRDPAPLRPGIYLGVRTCHPTGGYCWSLDLWSVKQDEFSLAHDQRTKWMDEMTEAMRLDILAIKDVVSRRPEYGRALCAVHVYTAVIEQGIRSVENFLAWWDGMR